MFHNIRGFFAICRHMKQSLPRKLFLTFFILISLNFLVGSMLNSHAQNLLKKTDTGVSFPLELNSSSIEFKLTSTGEKKFKIILDKKKSGSTKVKIYDILGNLIKEDNIKPEDGVEKSFDFSHINSQLFVVEVGNSKYNKTKSIYAQPQGKRKNIVDTESQ